MAKTSYVLQIVKVYEDREEALRAAIRAAKRYTGVAIYEETSTNSGQVYHRKAIFEEGQKIQGRLG